MSRFGNSGFAFRVTNSLDWVPQVPFTLEFPGDINTPNPLSALANPRLATIFAVVKPLVDSARNTILDHARQRLQPKAFAIAQRVAVAPVPQAELAVSGFDVTVVPSLNFVNAGTDISLIGTPCAGAQCQDAFSSTMPLLTSRCCKHKFHKLEDSPRCLTAMIVSATIFLLH